MFLTDFFKKGTHTSTKSTPQSLTADQLLSILIRETSIKAEEKIGSKAKTFGLPPDENSTREARLSYIEHLYIVLLQVLGPEIARVTFEAELEKFKKNFRSIEQYFQLLRFLPIPVMQSEKLALLNREELEKELRARITELETIKVNLENMVSQRTEVISAERNKLAIVLSGITDGVIAVDLQRSIATFNKAAEKITGYVSEEVIGKPITTIIKLFTIENQEIVGDVYSPIKTDTFEGILFQKERVKIVSEKKESVVNIVSGKIKAGVSVNLGCIITLHDITAEQQLEEMKVDFVAIAAHELRTPVTSIKGYLNVFVEENSGKLDVDQTDLIESALTATSKLDILIENLLNVSKIERGVLNMQTKPFDLVLLVSQVVSEFSNQAKEKQITLIFKEPQGQLPKVLADGVRISEVITNLVSNAIAYTNAGGSVTATLQAKNNEVIVSIADTGIGISKSVLPYLFTKFYRATGVFQNYSKGTGLGLYISKAIVEGHHGKIWVESEEGKGSTFFFSLPVAKLDKVVDNTTNG